MLTTLIIFSERDLIEASFQKLKLN